MDITPWLWKNLHVLAGLLIFRAVADPWNSGISAKSREIRQKYFQIHINNININILHIKSREMGRFFCEFWLLSLENRPKSADCAANFDFFCRENPAKSADFSANLPLKIPRNFAFFSAKYQKPCTSLPRQRSYGFVTRLRLRGRLYMYQISLTHPSLWTVLKSRLKTLWQKRL